MARSFNGTSDKLELGAGSLVGMTYGSFCAVVKVGTAQWNSVIEVETSAYADVISFEFSPTGNFSLSTDAIGAEVAGAPAVADGWCFVAAVKNTGTTTVAFWKYVYSTATWTTATTVGTLANAARTIAKSEIGSWENANDFFSGEIAAVAVFKNTVLTDAQIRSMATTYNVWVDTAPSAMWLLDQSATTMKVKDWVGDANEVTLTGTTVGTGSPPIGYTSSILTPSAIDAAAAADVSWVRPQLSVYRM